MEEKKVNFENTRSFPVAILRIVLGFAVYFVLNTVLKLPFPKTFLDSGTTAAMLVRAARYAVILFVEFGVYPMAFPWLDRLMGKKA